MKKRPSLFKVSVHVALQKRIKNSLKTKTKAKLLVPLSNQDLPAPKETKRKNTRARLRRDAATQRETWETTRACSGDKRTADYNTRADIRFLWNFFPFFSIKERKMYKTNVLGANWKKKERSSSITRHVTSPRRRRFGRGQKKNFHKWRGSSMRKAIDRREVSENRWTHTGHVL